MPGQRVAGRQGAALTGRRPGGRKAGGRPAIEVPAPAGVPGAPTACAAARATGGYTADDIASLFGFDSLYQQGRLGQGVTVALFELGNYYPSDIAAYDQCYGITTHLTRIPVDGGTPLPPTFTTPTATTGRGEVTLDIETVAGLAPDAAILDYEGNGDAAGFRPFYGTYAAIVQQNRAQVVSSSWGYSNCEADMLDGGVNLSLVEAPLFEEMAVQGQSMFTAAGDQGAQGCASTVGTTGANEGQAATPYAPSVEDPGDQPYITAVGGTQDTHHSLTPATQSVWNQTGPHGDGAGFAAPFDGQDGRLDGYPTTGNLAGSGGISAIFQMPPWQAGFDTSGNATGAPCGAQSNTLGTLDCRELPDVSGLARGVVTYTAGSWVTTGGTSAASPQWAALLALADQGTPQGRLGLVSPALYRIERTDPLAFTDITNGQDDYLSPTGTPDGALCTYDGHGGQPCYEATAGFDMATGLGTPVGGRLAADLDALQVGITTTTLAPGTVGRPYTAQLAATGGATPYTWALGAGTLPPGLSLDSATGVISGTPGAAGTYSFAVTVTASVPTSRSGAVDLAPSATTALSIAVAPASGYWEVGADGGVFAFGTAGYYGSMGGRALDAPVVGLAATPTGAGYWEVASDGGVFAFGAARYFGSMGGQPLDAAVVGLAATPTGAGYWEVASDGGVFAFGAAGYFGSMGGRPLDAAVVGLAATPTGAGYWEVASDGGVFAFGAARYFGSMGGQPLDAAVVGLAATPTGAGYWEVASDGGVFAFGAAGYAGSMGGRTLAAPVVGLVAPGAGGYWEVASDGGIFTFGPAGYYGSMGGQRLAAPIVALAADG